MLKLLLGAKKKPLWDFKGGIHPPEMKNQSNAMPLSHPPLPEQLIIPLRQHIGHEGEILVQPGDRVLRGQPLTFGQGKMLPVHASTSGTVTAIKAHMTSHPSALPEIAIFITPDKEDRWIKRKPITDYRAMKAEQIIDKLHQAGVAGLGGAGFPTAIKLRGGRAVTQTLIINAAECEPYITADDRLMQDNPAEILTGIRIIAWVLNANQIIIGIEDNKPKAIQALQMALGTDTDIIIRVIPTKYPSGGAKQLTKILTGKEVPQGGRSFDIGILMYNVATAYAAKRAIIDDEPLTERVVTLTGRSLAQPKNVWGRIGTPVSHLLACAGYDPLKASKVIMGGPLMGFTLNSLAVPIVKISNCLLAPTEEEIGSAKPEQACIRCSACADVCPAGLLPQQLFWYCQGEDHAKARAYNLNDCIECGACAYVCPSSIPLVQYYRREKAELKAIDLEAKRTVEAKARFEARLARLEREKQARESKNRQAQQQARMTPWNKTATDATPLPVDRGVSVTQLPRNRLDNRETMLQQQLRKAQTSTNQAETRQQLSGELAIEASIERSLSQAPLDNLDEPAIITLDDFDKTKTASCSIQATEASETVPNDPNDPEAPLIHAPDSRQAAVAAAIARVQAKKAAGESLNAAHSTPDAPEAPLIPAPDSRQAAVAAAIARVQAKKAAGESLNAAHSTPVNQPPSNTVGHIEQMDLTAKDDPLNEHYPSDSYSSRED